MAALGAIKCKLIFCMKSFVVFELFQPNSQIVYIFPIFTFCKNLFKIG